MPKAISQRGRLHSNLVSEAGFPAPVQRVLSGLFLRVEKMISDSEKVGAVLRDPGGGGKARIHEEKGFI